MPGICSICRKSDLLCGACSSLLAEGRVTQAEVDVSRAVERLVPGAAFLRAVSDGRRLVIVAGADAGKIIGKGGKNAKELGRLLGKEIDVIEQGDEKRMVEKMLRVPTLGINKVYGQQEKYRVRIEKRYRGRVRADTALIGKVLSKPVEIVFE